MLRFFLKSLFVVLLFVAGFSSLCRAQYLIPLDSVAKITFLTPTHSFSGTAFNKVEVVPEYGAWKAYQTERHTTKGWESIDDLMRKYLHDVPTNDIIHLIQIISHNDTTIHPDLFKINRNEIIDSIAKHYPFLQPRQKVEMIKDINTDSIFNKYLEYVIKHPMFGDDEDSYVIQTQTKGKKLYTIYARSYSYQRFYFLPWYVDKVKNYSPEITRIFQDVTRKPGFENWNLRNFISSVLFRLHFERYLNRFNWEDIKTYYPEASKLLNQNFVPFRIGASSREQAGKGIDKYYNIIFKGKGLPPYLRVNYRFNANDIKNVTKVKKYGDTLKQIFKTPNFLFNYLKSRPDATLTFSPNDDAAYGHYTIKSIKKFFPEIDNYSQTEVRTLDVKGKPDITSRWILLPDNTLLLCRYSPTSADNTKNSAPQFMGLDDEVIKLHNAKSYSVCLHFDTSGKLIKDYGDGLDIYFPH